MFAVTAALVFSLILTTREWVKLIRSRRAGQAASAFGSTLLSGLDAIAATF